MSWRLPLSSCMPLHLGEDLGGAVVGLRPAAQSGERRAARPPRGCRRRSHSVEDCLRVLAQRMPVVTDVTLHDAAHCCWRPACSPAVAPWRLYGRGDRTGWAAVTTWARERGRQDRRWRLDALPDELVVTRPQGRLVLAGEQAERLSAEYGWFRARIVIDGPEPLVLHGLRAAALRTRWSALSTSNSF